MNSISNAVQSYVNQIPKDALSSAAKGAVVSFAVAALFSATAPHCLTLGALAGCASLIHSFTAPLFKKMIHTEIPNRFENLAHIASTLALTQAVFNPLVPMHCRVNLVAGAVQTLAINLGLSFITQPNLDKALPYIFI